MGNATTWKKGQTGNAKGRPKKGYSISEYFRDMLASDPDTKQKICEAIRDKALAGDLSASKLIWEYMDGKPPQPIITSDGQFDPKPFFVELPRKLDTLQEKNWGGVKSDL